MTPSRNLGLFASLDKGKIGPDSRMVGGPQREVGGAGGVETYPAGTDGQWSRHPDIIDTPIKPSPIPKFRAKIEGIKTLENNRKVAY